MRAFVLVALLTTGSVPAFACTCPPKSPPGEAVAAAGAVFEGEVVRIRDRWSVLRRAWVWLLLAFEREPDEKDYGLEVEFKVTRWWRGPAVERITVYTGRGQGDCGYPFKRGERYLVYADPFTGGEWTTYICSRTRAIGEAAEDLAYLQRFELLRR